MRKSIALSVLGWLLAIAPAQAQVVFDANATASVGSATAVLSLSNSNLTVGAGSNRALIAQVTTGSNTLTVLTCVWDLVGANQVLTYIGNEIGSSGAIDAELWGLVNPVSGNKTLTCTFKGTVAFDTLNALSFTGVNQTGGSTTFYNANGANGSSTTASVTVTSAAGDAAVSAANTVQAFSAPTQTQTYNDTGNGGAGQRAAGAASVSFGWTNTPTGAWAEIATAIKAASTTANHNLLLIGVGQ